MKKMNDPIDLRSDTVTRPTPGMREAMFKAAVGDDVFREDPTVNALEEKAAARLGKEAALFVTSGTMANQIAIKILTQPGDEVIVEEGAHPFMYEAAAAGIISSVQLRPLPGKRGLLSPAQILDAIRPDDVHHPPTRLVCVENTHNRGGGAIYPLGLVEEIAVGAKGRGLFLHLDGARLFNACVASGRSPAEYARWFDTVSFCLSKGLGAPVGSLLVGGRDLMAKARRWRKVLGGGMRQAGFLAAAGLYALDNQVERLAEDHGNAGFLAQGLAEIEGLTINPDEVETNIVIFRVAKKGLTAPALVEGLKKEGVLMLAVGPDRIRAVTHLDVDRAGMETALKKTAGIMAAWS
ncbi:MAG: low-specificity L-threonine aldolase [Pseudomonadota bacterium]